MRAQPGALTWLSQEWHAVTRDSLRLTVYSY